MSFINPYPFRANTLNIPPEIKLFPVYKNTSYYKLQKFIFLCLFQRVYKVGKNLQRPWQKVLKQ